MIYGNRAMVNKVFISHNDNLPSKEIISCLYLSSIVMIMDRNEYSRAVTNVLRIRLIGYGDALSNARTLTLNPESIK